MARPTTRQPRMNPEELGPRSDLAPAPDSGTPLKIGEKPAARAGATSSKRGVPTQQLGVRIPRDLYQRLSAVSDETGISMAKLVGRAIEAELDRREA